MTKQERLAEMRRVSAFLDAVAQGKYVTPREQARRSAEHNAALLREHGHKMPAEIRKRIELSIAMSRRAAAGEKVSGAYERAHVQLRDGDA